MTLPAAPSPGYLVPAAAAAGLVAILGVRLGWLTRRAAWAATGVGALVTGGAGPFGGALLVWFFASASALGRLNPRREGPRRPRQVLANGGPAALVGAVRLGWATVAGPLPPAADPLLLVALAGSLAAMTADTWATEVGMASGLRPVTLPGLRPVPPGTSGGVTWAGSAAAVAGAASVAALAAVAGPFARPDAAWWALWAGGLVGALVDTLLGASWEARGWLDNDGVNALAALAGALAATAIYAWGARG